MLEVIDETKSPQGRPRDSAIDGAVLGAAAAIIASEGIAAATLEAIAARAGTTRASIYRRWPTRAELLVAVLGAQSEHSLPPPRGISAREDLLALLESFATMTRGRLGRIGPPIIAEVMSNPVARRAALMHSPSPRLMAEARTRLALALEEASVPASELDIRLEAIFGLIFLRALVAQRSPEADLPRKVLDLIVPLRRPDGMN